MATLNGIILRSTGQAPSPWERWPRGCPLPGPVPVTQPGDIDPVVAHSHIYFRPLDTPYIDSGLANAMVVSGPARARIECHTGAFSITLNQGCYLCNVGEDEFAINITSDDGVFNLQDVITSPMNFQPPASNAYQGTFPATDAAVDFVLPANAVGNPGAPVATAWTQSVQGPGKFQIEAAVMIQATSRDGNMQDNEVYTAYLWDSTDDVMVGQQVSVENIFTGTQGQLILRGTVTIAGASAILLEVYAAGNPNTTDPAAAPDSVGTIIMEQSSMSITRLQ